MRDISEFKFKETTAGGIIKAFRRNFKITQSELAEITGIAETNLSAIENDRIDIGVKRAVLIATALGIDAAQLLFPNGEESYEKEVEQVRQRAHKILGKKR